MHRTLKAATTVEAAWIVSFCLMVTMVAILVAYNVFGESIDYINQPVKEVDAVKIFRGTKAAIKFMDLLKE